MQCQRGVSVVSVEQVVLADGQRGFNVTADVRGTADFHTLCFSGIGGLGRDVDQKRITTSARVVFEGTPCGLLEVESSGSTSNRLEKELLEKTKEVARMHLEEALRK